MGWLVKIKSIHELKVDSMCVGSDISWSKLCNDVRASKYALSVVALSSFHQNENLALKSPKIKKLDAAVLLQSYSRSTINWYGAMFTCMVSSAVNIEVTCSLDTAAFILALCRLVALVAWKKHIHFNYNFNFNFNYYYNSKNTSFLSFLFTIAASHQITL